MLDALVHHRVARVRPWYHGQGAASMVQGTTKRIARWLLITIGLVSLNPVGAVTINLDEFQYDTVLLPFVPQQGTLSLCEDSLVLLSPVTCEAPVSDTVVFLADATTGMALLESNLTEPGTSTAPGDRVLLIPFPAPFFSIGELGAEETKQTLLYTPRLGQPGFALVEGVPVSYAITSDEVPEPATWLLLAGGLIGLLRLQRSSSSGQGAISWGDE